jgi:hypothetical protein
MSILSHQSAVNPTINFWGAGGGAGSLVPFVVQASVSQVEGTNLVLEENETRIILSATFPQLPYDVYYVANGATNLLTEETGITFVVGLSGTTMNLLTTSTLTPEKGWNGVPLSGGFLIPANIDGESLFILYSNSIQGGQITITNYNASWNIVGYPIPPP